MKLTNAVLRERQLIAASLLRAISSVGWTEEEAAERIGLKPRALSAWVNAEVAVRTEVVFACPVLGDAFRTALCSHQHESLVTLVRRLRKPRKGKR